MASEQYTVLPPGAHRSAQTPSASRSVSSPSLQPTLQPQELPTDRPDPAPPPAAAALSVAGVTAPPGAPWGRAPRGDSSVGSRSPLSPVPRCGAEREALPPGGRGAARGRRRAPAGAERSRSGAAAASPRPGPLPPPLTPRPKWPRAESRPLLLRIKTTAGVGSAALAAVAPRAGGVPPREGTPRPGAAGAAAAGAQVSARAAGGAGLIRGDEPRTARCFLASYSGVFLPGLVAVLWVSPRGPCRGMPRAGEGGAAPWCHSAAGHPGVVRRAGSTSVKRIASFFQRVGRAGLCLALHIPG